MTDGDYTQELSAGETYGRNQGINSRTPQEVHIESGLCLDDDKRMHELFPNNPHYERGQNPDQDNEKSSLVESL